MLLHMWLSDHLWNEPTLCNHMYFWTEMGFTVFGSLYFAAIFFLFLVFL